MGPTPVSQQHLQIEKWVAFLAATRMFHRLPDRVLRDVAANLYSKRVGRGEFVFREGEPATAVHLLAEGRIKIVRETEDGREVILRFVNPGEIFGGAGGWGDPVYPASAVAREDSLVLLLPSRAFISLIGTHPDLALAIIRELSSRLREAEARIQELQTERVERRIARALLRLANKVGVKASDGIEISAPLSRQDLAELSGATLSTASRVLSRWDEQGIVVAGRERVTIRQPHVLVAIAEDLLPPDDSDQ